MGEFIKLVDVRKANSARFMPGRTGRDASDTKIAFIGMRYSRNALKTPLGFAAGIAIGPGQHRPEKDDTPGFELSAGGVIIRTHVPSVKDVIPVHEVPIAGEDEPRKYVRIASFGQIEGELRAIAAKDEPTFHWEVWSGDFEESETAYQLIQENLFAHGSVAYSGGDVLVNAPATKRGKKSGVVDEDALPAGIRNSQAEQFAKEQQGRVVAGIPLWIARFWRARYSPDGCEAILVRQHDRFFLLTIEGGWAGYREMPAVRYERQFENLTVDQNLVPVQKAA